jgi:hypothetical protein
MNSVYQIDTCSFLQLARCTDLVSVLDLILGNLILLGCKMRFPNIIFKGILGHFVENKMVSDSWIISGSYKNIFHYSIYLFYIRAILFFCTFIKVLGFFPNKLCIEGNYFNIYDKHIVTRY